MKKQTKPATSAKMPSAQKTAEAMTGKPHKNDADVVHDDQQMTPDSHDPAVTIVKTETK